MITVGEFREAIEGMINYICMNEEIDFLEQIEGFEDDDTAPSCHVFLDAFRAYNALREADGRGYVPLGEFFSNTKGAFFICTNEECHYVGTKSDVLMDGQVLQLDANEPMPAGGCPHCGGVVRAI